MFFNKNRQYFHQVLRIFYINFFQQFINSSNTQKKHTDTDVEFVMELFRWQIMRDFLLAICRNSLLDGKDDSLFLTCTQKAEVNS